MNIRQQITQIPAPYRVLERKRAIMRNKKQNCITMKTAFLLSLSVSLLGAAAHWFPALAVVGAFLGLIYLAANQKREKE